MSAQCQDRAAPEDVAGTADVVTEVRREAALLKTGALQNAILNSANFSSIATDEKGVIQLFNVGAERMLGYTAIEVVDKITPADISDPQEVIARAKALSLELGTQITPGFEALVFKASRGIEDIYRVGDHQVEHAASGSGARRLPHSVAQHLAAAKLCFVAGNGEITLDLDQQFGIRQTDTIAGGRSVSSAYWRRGILRLMISHWQSREHQRVPPPLRLLMHLSHRWSEH